MTEQLLDGAQVSAAIEKVARKRMAQDVRADPVRIQPCFYREILEILGKTLARQMARSAV